MRLMILNDGETYTDAKGCMLIELKGFEDFEPDIDYVDLEEICNQLETKDSVPSEENEGVENPLLFTATVIARF